MQKNGYICIMKATIQIFATLASRLMGLTTKSDVVCRAAEQNPWFTPSEIIRSAQEIARTMLDAEALAEWMTHYPTLPVKSPRRVLIVMAGNIPFVGLFDLLCVVMSGNIPVIKSSSKDSQLMGWVVEMLHDIEPKLQVESFANQSVDAVIATGSESAFRHFKSQYAGSHSLLRGDRHSVAVLSGKEGQAELEALSQDIFLYSGLGCRNVSMIFAPQGMEICLTPPKMNPLYIDNYRHTKALLTMLGQKFIDLNSALLVESAEFTPALSAIALCRYGDIAEVERWIEEHDAELQCVVSRCVSHSRLVDFGQAQSPGLFDYADDVDTMRFLASIWEA